LFSSTYGYKENEFEEYHYKILTVAQRIGASKKAERALSSNIVVSGAGARFISTTNTEST
jgi:hypothetical protein